MEVDSDAHTTKVRIVGVIHRRAFRSGGGGGGGWRMMRCHRLHFNPLSPEEIAAAPFHQVAALLGTYTQLKKCGPEGYDD
jgi:hypothetical protein